jgi:predicted ferric reductase
MKKSLLGWLIVIIFSLVPLEIWATMQPLSLRFLNLAVFMASLGQLSALVGAVLLCFTFILSARIKLVDKIFGGQASVCYMHHLLGTISFLLILFHPIFLAVKFATFSLSSAFYFLLPGSDLAINLGIFSLVAMTLFLLFAFFFHIQYKKWKLIHQLLGLSFLLSIVHIFLITSDISRSFALKGYILGCIILGAASFLYKTVFHDWIIKDKIDDNKCEISKKSFIGFFGF